MFGTPGFIKFFWPKDNCETKYTSLYDIPFMDINKRITKFNLSQDKQFLLIHIKDSKHQQTVNKIKQAAKSKVYILPDQDSQASFEELKEIYPEALGKMITKGSDIHPLMKFIKRNCNQTFDYEMFGSKKTVPLGVYHKRQDGNIQYYSQEKLDKLFDTLKK